MTAQPSAGPPPSALARTGSGARAADTFDVGADKLMLLVEASGDLIGSLDIQQALPRVLDVSRQLIDADAYALWDYAPGSTWSVVSSHGLSSEYLAQSNIAVTDTTPTMHGTMVVPDVDSEPLLSERVQGYRTEGIRAMLVVALNVRGEAHGTITFYYRTPHAFTQQEIRIAEALGSVASAAISVSRFYHEQQEVNTQLGDLNQRLTLIAQCSATLSEPLEQTGDNSAEAAFSTALKKIANRIVPAFADVCVVDVFEGPDVTRRVETAVVPAVDAEALARMRVRNWRIAPDTSVTVGERIMTGLPVMVPALDEAWRGTCAPDADQLDAGNRLGITSFVMCPLVARGRVIGALSCGTVLVGRAFTEVDVAMLMEIARRAAHALDTTRLLDETRRIARELGIANAAKDEFLGLVSHELRTPLTIIRGNAEVLANRPDAIDVESRRVAMQDIAAESERLQAIIDNMLLLARLEQGQELEREPLLVVRVVQRLIDRHRRRNPGRSFEITQSGSAQPVSFAEVYLEQVIENLLSNAEKYSPPSRPITVEISRDSREVSIRVLDRGAGISDEEAANLFDAFYRSEETSRRASGLGIGLAVCKRLVTAQGGRVWARPRPDGGAEFGFSLPIIEDED